MTVPFLSLDSNTILISVSSFRLAIANTLALFSDIDSGFVSHHLSVPSALAPQDDNPHVVCASITRRKETTPPPGRVAESRHINFSPGPFYGPCAVQRGSFSKSGPLEGPCRGLPGAFEILASSWQGCRRAIDRVDDVF
jgi:hypothetical protein